MSRKLKVTVLVDENTIPADDPEFTGAVETGSTEFHVIQTLRELGHRVSVLGFVDDIAALVGVLGENRPDIVFNLTEHLGGDRRQDKNIAQGLDWFLTNQSAELSSAVTRMALPGRATAPGRS